MKNSRNSKIGYIVLFLFFFFPSPFLFLSFYIVFFLRKVKLKQTGNTAREHIQYISFRNIIDQIARCGKTSGSEGKGSFHYSFPTTGVESQRHLKAMLVLFVCLRNSWGQKGFLIPVQQQSQRRESQIDRLWG